MASLLHLSDPHFGTERPDVCEALLRCAADLQIDVTVVSGDITQRARAGQFRRARAFFARLQSRLSQRVPDTHLLVLPGNHDMPLFNVGVRLLQPFRAFRHTFGEALEPCYEDGVFHIQLVNTTRRWRHTQGAISPEQVDRVARRLEGAGPVALRVVVTHQPLLAVRAEDEKDVLAGRDLALRNWAAAGADVLLGGHIHFPYICAAPPSHPAGPGAMWVVQAGTALSWRIRHEAGNSFNVIRYDKGRRGAGAAPACSVERWDYDERHDRFDCRLRTALALVPR